MDSKNQFFLDKLDSVEFKKYLKDASQFDYLNGPGFKKKFLRLFTIPNIYISYVLMRLGLYPNKRRIFELFWGKSVSICVCDYDSWALKTFRIAGGNEAELKLLRFLIKNLGNDDIFYDIGANYGFYTYLSSELCKEVHAFEPLPKVFGVLLENTKGSKNVFLNNEALSDMVGSVDIYYSERFTGISTISKQVFNANRRSFGTTLKVKTIRLDDYVKKHPVPTFIKLDVEGAEIDVINGGVEFLSKNSPIIAMEVWSKKENGSISMLAVQKLLDLGYGSYFIDIDGNINKFSGDLSLNVERDCLVGDNYIFIKS